MEFSFMFIKKSSWLILAIFCLFAQCCMSDNAVGIVGRALECFNDNYVYSSCQESYRLTAQGAINVPLTATDSYCGGPCLEETNLVLKCIDDIMYNFRFYDGASVRDVRFALSRGCGHSAGRGNFNVLQNLGARGGNYNGYDDYYYDDAINLAIPKFLLMILLLSWTLLLI
ncbi:hypothetical protein LUZ60_009548 [Juncus effusus]|nr:hypothetical protein LUZ60_009548 [Juncus effusus]